MQQAKVRFELIVSDFRAAANGCCRNIAKNIQQQLGFRTEFSVALREAVCACSKTRVFGVLFKVRHAGQPDITPAVFKDVPPTKRL